MKIEFSLGKSIGRYSARLFTLILTLSMLALAAIQAGSGFYQAQESDEWRNQVHEVLRDTEETFARFRAMRQQHGKRGRRNEQESLTLLLSLPEQLRLFTYTWPICIRIRPTVSLAVGR